MRRTPKEADQAIDRFEGSGRPPLDRDRIVATAVSFIDASGVDALTMRRLGALMGVEAMSLYRYVASREALLDAVVDRVMAELDHDPELRGAGEAGWEDFVVRVAHGVRRMALAHPQAFPLLASRPTAAPFVRPPLRTLSWTEAFLTALTDDGFAAQEAVTAHRAFSGSLLGHLLLEVGSPGSAVDAAAELDGQLRHYPTIKRLGQELDADGAAREFDALLAALVERLGRLRVAA